MHVSDHATWQEIAERRMAEREKELEQARKADPQRFVNGFREERDEDAKPNGRLFGGADREDYD